jgi:hypothetical protein
VVLVTRTPSSEGEDLRPPSPAPVSRQKRRTRTPGLNGNGEGQTTRSYA